MSRSKFTLFCALAVVMMGLESFAAAPANAQCCYGGWWQRGPLRRTVAFVVSPWVASWRLYYGYGSGRFGGYGASPYYGAWPNNYGLGPAYSVQSSPPSAADTGALVVHVPSNAKVWINGEETKSQGDERKYYSQGLAEGEKYKYVIRAVATRAGSEVGDTKTVYLTAGKREEVTMFDTKPGTATVASFSKPSDVPVETVLRLHVPADARVTLGGNPSKLTGELRTYRTKKLAAGQQWEGYTIHAVLERDGQRHVANQTITLTGGDTRDLTLDFAPERIAQR